MKIRIVLIAFLWACVVGDPPTLPEKGSGEKMAKPNIALARFASLPSANRISPTGAQRDNGFQPGDIVPDSIHNELWYQGYLWDLYLDQGEFEGDHSIDGELTTTGAITAAGLVAATDYRHGNVTSHQSAAGIAVTSGSVTVSSVSDAVAHVLSSGGIGYVPLRELMDGDRIKSVALTALATSEPVLSIVVQQAGIAATVAVAATGTIVTNGLKTLTVSTPFPLSGQHAWLKVNAALGSVEIRQVSVVKDRAP